jgi:hypothetical protein
LKTLAHTNPLSKPHPAKTATGAHGHHLAAIIVIFSGLLARIWVAHGTFLHPDEALHFRLANQPTLALAYKESLTASHPPLLTFVLYYWRALGTSELWLRMPLILASVAFCWVFYKWLAKAAGEIAGFVGLLFVAFLPPIVVLSAEIRQYPLLLMFLAAALYFLDSAFDEKSAGKMVAFSACLYLAMLSHYSAFWFAVALGIYALFRICTERLPGPALAAWIAGQLGGIGLALFLYQTHISKLGAGYARPVSQGWMSDEFLSRSYFDPAHNNPIAFLVGHSFGVFQYFWGQLAVGDVTGLLFLAGVFFLLRGKTLQQRRLCLLVFLPFAVASVLSLAHLYPYGGTRHVAFLIIPGAAGVSVAIVQLISHKFSRAVAFAAVVIAACLVFGKPRQPRMTRANQSRPNMIAAMNFISQNLNASDLIFTDYQSDLLLGHYLCEQQPVVLETAPLGYEQFSCSRRRVISVDFRTWLFTGDGFVHDWQQFMQDYRLQPGTTVWVVEAGWYAGIADELQKNFAEFRGLKVESFGNSIKIFKMIVGDPLPTMNSSSDQSSQENDDRR